MNIQIAVEKLNSHLPLKARQEKLPFILKVMHQKILSSLVLGGRPPNGGELRAVLGEDDVHASLQRLGADDLVVLDHSGQRPLGAYPVTTENTPHRITVNGHHIFAMCALDAVSVAPLFNMHVHIESVCQLSGRPIIIRMQGSSILEVQPDSGVMVGVHWQVPSAVAAHSLCMEMVFLKDRQTAEAWQGGDTDNISLFDLPEAVTFGRAFFMPLLD